MPKKGINKISTFMSAYCSPKDTLTAIHETFSNKSEKPVLIGGKCSVYFDMMGHTKCTREIIFPETLNKQSITCFDQCVLLREET